MAQLYFKFGAMGSSKTANALMTRFNYEERGQQTLLVKPRVDTRDGDHMVVSRIGLTYPCIYFDEMRALSVMELQQNACIIVDEAPVREARIRLTKALLEQHLAVFNGNQDTASHSILFSDLFNGFI